MSEFSNKILDAKKTQQRFIFKIILAIFLSFLIYHLFERPVMNLRDGVPDDGLIKAVLSGRRGIGTTK